MAKPSLAFRRVDPDRERSTAARILRHADRLSRIQVPDAATTKVLTTVVADLRKVAEIFHPSTLRYATVDGRSGAIKVALIDSRSIDNYRLLPCTEARRFDLGRSETASRWRVEEWPTLKMAVEFARRVSAAQKALYRLEVNQEKKRKPIRNKVNRIVSTMKDRRHALQMRQASKVVG